MANRETWMADLDQKLAGKSLRDVALPGAHDAGTGPITQFCQWSADAGLIQVLGGKRVAPWSRAQGLNLYQLVAYGVRYLDLRVERRDADGRFSFPHSLLGDFAVERLYDLRAFLEKHPKEILVLDFQEFHNMRPKDHSRYARTISLAFGNKLAPPPAAGAPIPTVGEMWARGWQVVALYNEPPASKVFTDNPRLWPRGAHIRSYWAETNDIGELEKRLANEVNNNRPSDPAVFWVLQGVLTPGLNIDGSLQEWAFQDNDRIISWFTGPWADRGLNILMVDWVQYGDVVLNAIEMNER